MFQPGGWCEYDEVMLQDGHVWIGYDWWGQRYYLPIRTWDSVAPPNQGLGDLWGTIKQIMKIQRLKNGWHNIKKVKKNFSFFIKSS